MPRRPYSFFLKTILIAILSSCGGGGGDSTDASSLPTSGGSTPTPTPAPTPAPSPSSSGTVTLAAPATVEDGAGMGQSNSSWGSGSTPSGGHGQMVDGFACGAAGANYTYAHLSIYRNGTLLSLPQNIGVVSPTATSQRGCLYPAHTRDTSGKIHLDAGKTITLGQFFDIWGQPLSSSSVAGVTDQPFKIYTNDGGTLTEYTGDPAALPLLPHREITIVAGTAVSQIPTYSWKNPPPLSGSPILLWQGNTIGTPAWADGDTASGGHGVTTSDGVTCDAGMSDNYHVHVHLAIIKDGVMRAVPEFIGLPGNCFYETHTHDNTGVMHIEALAYKDFKLGNFFTVWGQPLSKNNAAGFTGEPIKTYINDNGDVWEYQGNPADIDMISHRSITIQVGSDISEIPSYNWGDNAQ